MDVRQTQTFADWLKRLADLEARARVQMRLDRVGRGLFGDVKSVGGGVSEMRIDHGPGYRLYFTRRGTTTVLLLVGGDKRYQSRDIAAAQAMATELVEDWR